MIRNLLLRAIIPPLLWGGAATAQVRSPGGALTPEQKQWLAAAGRHEQEGWVVVRCAGTPRALGFQHGYLLAREIAARSPDPPKEGCSNFIATGSWTSDGGIVLGHNTMTSYTTADCNIILDLTPSSGHRILMQGAPGWVHSGTDFFLTDAGLIGSETTISGFTGFDTSGIPEFVRMRRATQVAGSIDQWCEMMKAGNNGGYAIAWLIGDVNTGEIARLELGGGKNVAFERTRDGYFVGSNVAEDLRILPSGNGDARYGRPVLGHRPARPVEATDEGVPGEDLTRDGGAVPR